MVGQWGIMPWAEQEFAGFDLGDARLDRRRVRLTETFARQPQASIPSACGGWAETQGAYRFPRAEGVGLAGYSAAALELYARAHGRASGSVCLQETTELDFNGQQIVGLAA